MEKLVHGIAVVIGFILWQLTENIIVAAILAVVAEGIILTITVAVAQHKNDVAAAVAEGRTPPKRLWWRILLVVVLGFWAIYMLAFLFYIIEIAQKDYNLATHDFVILAMIFVSIIIFVLCVVSLVKAIRYNKRLGNAKGD